MHNVESVKLPNMFVIGLSRTVLILRAVHDPRVFAPSQPPFALATSLFELVPKAGLYQVVTGISNFSHYNSISIWPAATTYKAECMLPQHTT